LSITIQAGNGKPLNLDNLARRVIVPALSRCAVCRKLKDKHKPEGHVFQRDQSLPQWHGWHALRRGLATNLHTLKVDDKTIQAILRHSNVSLTQNIYIKSVTELQVDAMDSLSARRIQPLFCRANKRGSLYNHWRIPTVEWDSCSRGPQMLVSNYCPYRRLPLCITQVTA
jgi:hypothetical protein